MSRCQARGHGHLSQLADLDILTPATVMRTLATCHVLLATSLPVSST
jgi:hypothetical protein